MKKFIKSLIISSIILIVSLLLTIKMIGISFYFVTSAKTSFVILGILIIVASIFLFIVVCETQFYSIKWKIRVKKIEEKNKSLVYQALNELLKKIEEKNKLEE
jgi:membrane protein YdbS with pleckstrin-like domain